ncbi:transcription repressor OFP14-like [Musa acuminata AAA Group]|uniref:transcription repressor OFP14-like n=1 Tax=Musa acuminata AAA Group TaxID=214697 RepID=UPI0031CEC11C
MGRKKATERSRYGSFARLSKPLSKPSICLWLLSGRKCLINTSSDSENDRTAAAINFDDDEEDICRAYYISKPTDISPRLTWPPPHVIRASERFFVPPTAASSLVEEVRASSTSQSDMVSVDSTAVITFSKDPCHDFLISMQEMMEAHNAGGADDQLDWEFMEQLLLCYLELNEQSVHKDILRAFTDLTAAFRRVML